MRPRNRLSADQWAARLDACMRMVLADPASFPEVTVLWARWRRTWLAESGSPFREPVARAEVDEGEGLTGPSSSLPRAGGTVCAPGLAAGPKKWPKRSVRGATAAESTTSSHSSLSPNGDNRGARGGGNGARAGGARRWSGEKTFALQIVLC
jgi:hypothetical protein